LNEKPITAVLFSSNVELGTLLLSRIDVTQNTLIWYEVRR
jgi:hypothetical protein